MALTVGTLLDSMLAAARTSLGSSWQQAAPFALTEFKSIAQQIVTIEADQLAGTLSEEQAALLLDMQKNASKAALSAIEGIGLVAAQNAINAALGAVATLVNTTLGFQLL